MLRLAKLYGTTRRHLVHWNSFPFTRPSLTMSNKENLSSTTTRKRRIILLSEDELDQTLQPKRAKLVQEHPNFQAGVMEDFSSDYEVPSGAPAHESRDISVTPPRPAPKIKQKRPRPPRGPMPKIVSSICPFLLESLSLIYTFPAEAQSKLQSASRASHQSNERHGGREETG